MPAEPTPAADCVVCGEPFNDADEVAAHVARWHRQDADYERAWNLLRVRLVERFQMASEALKREGLDYAARLVPIEEVLVWMDEEEEVMGRTEDRTDLLEAARQ